MESSTKDNIIQKLRNNVNFSDSNEKNEILNEENFGNEKNNEKFEGNENNFHLKKNLLKEIDFKKKELNKVSFFFTIKKKEKLEKKETEKYYMKLMVDQNFFMNLMFVLRVILYTIFVFLMAIAINDNILKINKITSELTYFCIILFLLHLIK